MAVKLTQGIFFSYYWYIDEKEKDIASIRAYGLDEHNKNICLRIDDFTPYIYLELPVKTSNGSTIDWKSKVQSLGERLDEILHENKPIKKKLQYKHKLYGAEIDKDGNKKVFPYLLCSFSNKTDYKNLFYILKKPIYILGLGQIKLKMHEQDASEILQLVSCRDIPTAGWIKFRGREIFGEEKLTICDKEYIVGYQQLSKFDKNILACPKIMGFDIEVNSTNPSAMPQASKPGDKIFQISCVFSREGEGEDKYDNYLLTLGEVDPELLGDNVNAYMFESEADLLEGFTELVREENPNIIVGYNILKFDIQYMIDRAKSSATHFCFNEFAKLGFHKDNISNQEKIKWSSSAFKNQEFDYLDAEGRVFVDLLPLIQRDYKFNNYQLKTVSKELLKDTKDDLSPKGIFKCYRVGIQKELDGTYSKKAIKAMSICGKYCLKDSILVVKLMEKLKAWVGLAEMAKTTNISIFDVFTQGQQKKVYSQIYKYCMYQNIVVEKDAYITKENERYVGAHVFPPVPGNYERVLPFDFASLYPTTIIAYNIDYSSWVNDSSIPDEKCNVFKWRDCIGCKHDPKVIKYNELTKYVDAEKDIIKKLRDERDNKSNKLVKQKYIDEINKKIEALKPYISERSDVKKTISKTPMCEERYYRFLKEPKGVVPTILQNLLDARKNTRKQIKNTKCKHPDCGKIAEYGIEKETHCMNHKEEKEIKILSDNQIKDIDDLTKVLDKRQLAYKICANSVAGTTPIPCKINGYFIYKTIEEISKGDWKRINEEQEVSTPIDNLEVWSDTGFTKPKYIMRHPKNENLFRVNTHTGSVDCTGDHSLLRYNGEEVKPKDLKIGDRLLQKDFPLPIDTPGKPLFLSLSNDTINDYILSSIEEELAFVHGVFFAEGTCGTWGVLGKAKTSWIIYNQDYRLLERCKNILNKVEKEHFKISDYYESSRTFHLVPTVSIINLSKKYREMFYDKRKYKKFPDYIFNAPFKIRQAFFMGYYNGDGNRNLKVGIVINNKGNRGSASLFYLAKSLGYKVSVSYTKDKDSDFTYRLQCCTDFRIKKEDSVKRLEIISQSEEKISKTITEKIIRNDELIEFNDGKSCYRNITIYCERFPRQKLLDSLDDAILCANNKFCYVTEYFTNGKYISCKKYCCGKEYKTKLQTLKNKLSNMHNFCMCNKEHFKFDCKNKKNIYIEKDYIEYVYDIETENHHFAAGVGNMIVHNSMYGILGVKKGLLPFMPGAMCCTFMGRTNIEIVADTITKKYGGKLVYGDTDSNYITFPHLKNSEESWDYALKVSKEVSALFPPPIYLEFEQAIYAQFFILTKKRYMYRACGRDGVIDKKIGKKGVLLARRDNSLLIRLIYEKLISMIFDKIPRDDVLYYILEELNRICSNSVPHKEYVITKSVGDVNNMNISDSYKDEKGKFKVKVGNYIVPLLPKNAKEKEKEMLKKEAVDEIDYYRKCLPAVVQLAEKMRSRGQRVDVGTRLEYVIVDVGKNKKQYEKIDNIDYFLQHNDILRIDFLDYVKLMINPIDDLLNVAFQKNIQDGYRFKKDFLLEQYKFRSITRKKVLDELKALFSPTLVFTK